MKHNRNCRRPWAAAGIVMGAMTVIGASMSRAAEWYVLPNVSLRSEYNDNRTLSANDHENLLGWVADAQARLGVRIPNAELALTPRYRLERYRKDRNLDADDRYLDLYSLWAGPRSRTELLGGLVRNTTLTTESSDVGVVDVRLPRESERLNPRWQYQWSERTSVSADFSRENVRYKEAENSPLNDYRFDLVSASWQHAFSPRTSFVLQAYQSNLEVSRVNYDTRDTGATLGVDYQAGERWRLNASLGRHRLDSSVESSTDTIRDSDYGRLYDLGLRHQTLVSEWSLRLNQSVVPSGFGFLAEREEATLNWDRRWNERWNSTLRAKAFQNRALDTSSSSDNRDYQNFDLVTRWQATAETYLYAGYVYARQQYEFDSRVARSNAVSIGIGLRGDPLSISR